MEGFLMEKNISSNHVYLAGHVVSGPVFSHRTYGEEFYMVILGILRKSGYEDRIRMIVSERLMGRRCPESGEFLEIQGQIRTYNREESGRNRLDVTVFVQELCCCGSSPFEYGNRASLDGFICKEPVRRTSPLGREICDLMIAVNRMYNKSDYIPSIAWGRNAVYGSGLCVGDRIYAEGRLQSREYRKYDEDGSLTVRTAYEVSISRMDTGT